MSKTPQQTLSSTQKVNATQKELVIPKVAAEDRKDDGLEKLLNYEDNYQLFQKELKSRNAGPVKNYTDTTLLDDRVLNASFNRHFDFWKLGLTNESRTSLPDKQLEGDGHSRNRPTLKMSTDPYSNNK